MDDEIAKTIASLELRLTRQGWKPHEIAKGVCDVAGINSHTWRRWRRGEHAPNMAKWRQAEKALVKLEGKRDGVLARRRGRAAKAVSR
jgi:hypothetical protein